MANPNHLEVLKQGVEEWNKWREGNPNVQIELSFSDLRGANLKGVNLKNAILKNAKISGADLTEANLSETQLLNTDLTEALLIGASLHNSIGESTEFTHADLTGAILSGASLRSAQMEGANLTGAELIFTNLYESNLKNADLSRARLWSTNLTRTILNGSIFNEVRLGGTVLCDTNLSNVRGLDTCLHMRETVLDVRTLMRSGELPPEFLRSSGLPEVYITYLSSLKSKPIEFYSCFISYSGKDDEFARRLQSRMREAGLRVWFAPEDIKGGDKIYDQIDRAIQVHDRLLLVLSESSLQSKWVETEIRRARKVELKEGRRKLFPIRLTSYESLQEWVCIDSATGEDLAEEVRGYFIPDFSTWKSHDDFERAFARLYEDLKASA